MVFLWIALKKMAEGENGGQKHSEVQPRKRLTSIRSKALQHVARESRGFGLRFPLGAIFFYLNAYNY